MASPSGHDSARAPAPADHEAAPQYSQDPSSFSDEASPPTLVGDRGDAVAFLDAPGLSTQELLDTVAGVLASMSDGAILTVFTDDPTASHTAPNWCTGRRVELLAVIPHNDRTGTTLTFRQAEPGSGSLMGVAQS
jgi:TusA-related sulfurtransferase